MRALRAVGVSGSPSAGSRSRALVTAILAYLAATDVRTGLVDLADLPADALLARRREATVEAAVADVRTADIVVLSTPIYRASYTGQLKAFFDLFPQEALRDRVVGLVATGASAGHLLALDHGLRPLVASLGGLTAARTVYAVDAQVPSGGPIAEEVDRQLQALAVELRGLASAAAGVPLSLAPSDAPGMAPGSGQKDDP